MTPYAVVPVVTNSTGTHYVRRVVSIPGGRGPVVLLTECGAHVTGHRTYGAPSSLTCPRCVRSLA